MNKVKKLNEVVSLNNLLSPEMVQLSQEADIEIVKAMKILNKLENNTCQHNK